MGHWIGGKIKLGDSLVNGNHDNVIKLQYDNENNDSSETLEVRRRLARCAKVIIILPAVGFSSLSFCEEGCCWWVTAYSRSEAVEVQWIFTGSWDKMRSKGS